MRPDMSTSLKVAPDRSAPVRSAPAKVPKNHVVFARLAPASEQLARLGSKSSLVAQAEVEVDAVADAVVSSCVA